MEVSSRLRMKRERDQRNGTHHRSHSKGISELVVHGIDIPSEDTHDSTNCEIERRFSRENGTRVQSAMNSRGVELNRAMGAKKSLETEL